VITSGLYIYNEQIANIGTDYAIITWQTNLFSSSRIIYSEAGKAMLLTRTTTRITAMPI